MTYHPTLKSLRRHRVPDWIHAAESTMEDERWRTGQ